MLTHVPKNIEHEILKLYFQFFNYFCENLRAVVRPGSKATKCAWLVHLEHGFAQDSYHWNITIEASSGPFPMISSAAIDPYRLFARALLPQMAPYANWTYICFNDKENVKGILWCITLCSFDLVRGNSFEKHFHMPYLKVSRQCLEWKRLIYRNARQACFQHPHTTLLPLWEESQLGGAPSGLHLHGSLHEMSW